MGLGSERELASMLRTAGVPVAVAGSRTSGTYGILDRGQVLEDGGDGLALEALRTTLLVRSGDPALVDVVHGTSVLAAGTTYRVRDVQLVDDGALTRFVLAEVS